MRTTPFLATLLTAIAAAPAQEFWVDAAAGNDANPGTASAPFKSIARAAGIAGAGARIFVRPGVYGPAFTGEVLPIALGSLPQQGLELRGLGPPGAVVIDLAGAADIVFQIDVQAAGGRLTNLTFTRADTTQWWTHVIDTISAACPFEIDRCAFHQVNRGIVVWGASAAVVGLKIHDNLFFDLANDAIDEFGAGCANEIAHNTIAGTAGSANLVGILTEGAQTLVRNNLITDMRDGIVTGASSPAASFAGNDCWNNARNWSGAITARPPGNYRVDPRYVSRAGRDFHLQSTSPLIEAGASGAVRRADLDNVSRSVDGNGDGFAQPDVGAYELSPVAHTVVRGTGRQFTFTVTAASAVASLVAFALDEGVVPVQRGTLLLLDPSTLFPLIPAGPSPLTVILTALPVPPGWRVVTQGVGLDLVRGALLPAQAVWTEL